jgi:hypothetical protein
VRDDSLWLVIDDVTRISFIAGDHGGARLQGGINETIEFAYDSIFVDADTNTATPIILFGGYGGALRWNRATDKMQFSNDLSAWSDIGTSSGLAAADFNDSLESQIEFSPKTHAKLDSSTAVRGAINDSLQTNWATFTAGGSSIKWRDSSYLYLDTANVLGGNTEIKAWLDTTAVRVPIADSTHGGATNATTCKTADSAIAIPDSIDCNAVTVNRRVKSQGLDTDSIVISGDNISDFAGDGLTVSGSNVLDADLGTAIASGEITDQTIVRADIDSSLGITLTYLHRYNSNVDDSSYLTKKYCDDNYTGAGVTYDNIGDPTGDGSIPFGAHTGTYTSATSAWDGLIISNTVAEMAAEGQLLTLRVTDATDIHHRYLVAIDGSDTVAIIGHDGVYLGTAAQVDSALITKGYGDAKAFDSVAAWANLVNDDRDSVLAFTSIVSEAKDSLTSWANEVNIATDSLASWGNKINADMMYNDGDTTTGTYVFSSAFRGVSAVVESCYATLETIEDSLALCHRYGDTLTRAFAIIDPAVAHDLPLWQTKRAITIVAVSAVSTAGTNTIGCLDEYNATGTSVDAAVDGDWTITTSEYTDASFTNAAVDAGDWLGWHTTSVSGEVTSVSITFEYVETY